MLNLSYRIQKADRHIKGHIQLDGSKSISNRGLIIRALCAEYFSIEGLSSSMDTSTLKQLLDHPPTEGVYDAGAAGTSFRFLTAYLSLQPGTQLLTGSDRMKERPVGLLVEALRSIGAQIEYVEKDGFPPLLIHTPQTNKIHHIQIATTVSSQFISALLMIAPLLPNGLTLELTGKIVSLPYIEMTLKMMAYFGVETKWEAQQIFIAPQQYKARNFKVEADWSAASYYYALAAFSDQLELKLEGLHKNSMQGDAVIEKIMKDFGVTTSFNDDGIFLKKGNCSIQPFHYNFIKCPDIAQTLAVVCAGLGKSGCLNGLDTLSIKETNRTLALQQELHKVGVDFAKDDSDGVSYYVNGKANVDQQVFDTYHDHRMAMAFAPLALYGTIFINNPNVVSKSYPDFWLHLKELGFMVEEFPSFQ